MGLGRCERLSGILSLTTVATLCSVHSTKPQLGEFYDVKVKIVIYRSVQEQDHRCEGVPRDLTTVIYCYSLGYII